MRQNGIALRRSQPTARGIVPYRRYALYYTPEPGTFARAGAHWLGWDIAAGAGMASVAPDLTKRPSRYGFHATLKPPFTLAPGCTEDELQREAAALAARLTVCRCDGLDYRWMGRFLALTPAGDTGALTALARECLRDLDRFRAPLTPAEFARKGRPGMAPGLIRNLETWGYPHVMEAFRFHMTLTGPVDKAHRTTVQDRAATHFDAVLSVPFQVDAVTLAGEDSNGLFHQIARYPLGLGGAFR